MDDARAQLQAKLAQMRQSFVASLSGLLESIDRSWGGLLGETLDPERVQEAHRLAHQLAGSGGTFGLPELSRAARPLELGLREVLDRAQPPDAPALERLEELRRRLREVVEDARRQAREEADATASR